MDVHELIRGLGEKLNGLELAFDDEGILSLDIDSMSVTVMNLDEARVLALYGVVGLPPPEDDMTKLYHALLEANHSYAGTAGATLSLNAETGDVELCKAISLLSLDVDALFSELERFVNTLETWRKIVADFRTGNEKPAPDDAAPASDAPLGDFGFMKV